MNQSDVDTLISQVHATNDELDARAELGKLLTEIQEGLKVTIPHLRKFEALAKACGEEELFQRRMRVWGLSEEDKKAPS